jgi:class 3 adenylate cyclase
VCSDVFRELDLPKANHMSNASLEYVRIDMISEVIASDESSRTIRMILTPDPRRYDKFKKDGETQWRDKFLDFVFGWDTLTHTALPPGASVFYSPAKIHDAGAYAVRRTSAVRREFAGSLYEPPAEIPDQHRGLPQEPTEIKATFLSLDIVDSTKTRKIYRQRYDTVIDLMFREMGTMIGYFHGSILKLTGDGFICFLDDSSINSQCDNSVNLGLSLLGMLDALNESTPKEYPKLKVRIGAEHGLASVKRYVVPATGYEQTDIASDALNRASRIQENAPPTLLQLVVHSMSEFMFNGLNVPPR